MSRKMTLTIVILVGIAVIVVGAAWYLSLPQESPLGTTPIGSFSVVENGNDRAIQLTFMKNSGDALYEYCSLEIANPQGTHYNWNLMGIEWTNNEANNDSVIPGFDLRIIRSNGQTTFSTGNIVELEMQSGTLAEGNWTITLNFRPTGGGLIATKTVTV